MENAVPVWRIMSEAVIFPLAFSRPQERKNTTAVMQR